MSRAYIVYILMFAVLIGGMWLILTAGRAMVAPDDLAGEWTVAWDAPAPPAVPGTSMRIDQSGRFFVVRFEGWPPLGLQLQPGWRGAHDGRKLAMSLAGQGWKLNLWGDIPLGESRSIPQARIELIGPTRHAGVARRNDLPQKPATRPAAGMTHAR